MALEVRLDESGLSIGGRARAPPATAAASCWTRLRAALAPRAPAAAGHRGVPLAGGLVGYAAYDIVRYFERLPRAHGRAAACRALHYVAPRSMLVFDHLTRGIALVHAGVGGGAPLAASRGGARPARRAAGGGARRALLRAARRVRARGLPGRASGARRSTSPPATSTSWCSPAASRGRHDLDPFQAYRALRLINPSPYMYYCALGDVAVVGSSPEALVKLNGRQAQLRPIAGTRPRGADGRE